MLQADNEKLRKSRFTQLFALISLPKNEPSGAIDPTSCTGGWPGVPNNRSGALCLTLEYFYMKKTLIALAVLATAGTAFAQVTISGRYAYGYRVNNVAGGSETGGFGVRDSFVKFSATEDLGGGMKAAANMQIESTDRAQGVTGGDSSLALTTSVGTLTMGNGTQYTDTADMFGVGMYSGGPFLGDRQAYTNTEVVQDFVSFATSFGPVGVTLMHREAAASFVGSGAAGSTTQRDNTIALSYAGGPLSVYGDYTAYDNKAANTAGSGGFDNRMTLGGNYDFGVVKLGLGVQTNKYTQGKSDEAFIGVSVPLGNLSLAADFTTVKASDTNTFDGNANAYGLQAKYNLSKRTDIRARYMSIDRDFNATGRSSRSELLLRHSF
jgi:predicted porin